MIAPLPHLRNPLCVFQRKPIPMFNEMAADAASEGVYFMSISTQPQEEDNLCLHVSLCAERFGQLEKRLDRLENLIIGANAAVFAALVGILIAVV